MSEYGHKGKTLREWLLQSVDDSAGARREASAVLMEFFYSPAEELLKKGADSGVNMEWCHVAVREVVGRTDFPRAEFVQRLLSLSIVLEERRLANWREESRIEDEWHDREAAKLGNNPSPAEVRRYLKRIWVRLCRNAQKFEEDDGAEDLISSEMALNMVIDCLGVELLPAASLIRYMLNEKNRAWIASKAIERMGRAGLEFWPDLVAGLGADDPNSTFSKPLGILLREVPERIGEIVEMTRSENGVVRYNSIMALGWTGREVMRAHPEVEGRLLEILARAEGEEWMACASSLGEVGISTATVSAFLELSRSDDPERVGYAIRSLGRIGLEGNRVVPRLIELLDEFQEFDSDFEMYGKSSRVVDALIGFGAEAAAAIPVLVKRIWAPEESYDKEGKLVEQMEPDQSVITLLGELGAHEALPLLRGVKEEMIRRGVEDYEPTEPGEETIDPESFCPAYLSEAIERIEGELAVKKDGAGN